MHRLAHLTRVAGLGALLAAAACSSNDLVLSPSLAGGNEMFRSYVALGNSITAGYQSGGINDSTQRQSYARLLADQMGTQYHYPSLAMPGCTPPIANTRTGALVGNAPATTCALRAGSQVVEVLNNVAVPGATSADPTSASTAASNALTTFVLGGRTQVSRALMASPTFATIWIGNNDVLQPALSGLYQPVTTTQARFQANYDAMMKQLTDSAPGIKGVLIGVAKAQYLPTMVQGSLLTSATMTQLTGRATVVDPSCTGSTALVNIVSLIQAIRAGTHPALVACQKGVYPAPIGDVYVLDPAEQTTLDAVIDGYNDYIKGKATAAGFAYWDPNPTFQASRASGAIPPFPNFASTNATFGSLISLDGIHPSAAGHVLIANALITAINTTYGTSLKPVQ